MSMLAVISRIAVLRQAVGRSWCSGAPSPPNTVTLRTWTRLQVYTGLPPALASPWWLLPDSTSFMASPHMAEYTRCYCLTFQVRTLPLQNGHASSSFPFRMFLLGLSPFTCHHERCLLSISQWPRASSWVLYALSSPVSCSLLSH